MASGEGGTWRCAWSRVNVSLGDVAERESCLSLWRRCETVRFVGFQVLVGSLQNDAF